MNSRKKQIIDAAHRLFVEKGFALTSIQDILDEAGVAKGTFYNYFASKNECLMAIMEFVKEEVDQKRREIAYGKRKDDENVFVQQIIARFNMNRQHNLIAVFESVSVSDDPDLKAFLKMQHCAELEWLASRIKEVFHLETNRHTLDYAAILIGITHQFMRVWKLGTTEKMNSETIITFALASIKTIASAKGKTDDAFFPENWLAPSKSPSSTDVSGMKKQLSEQIGKLIEKLEKQEENLEKKIKYAQFIIEEINQDNPRLFLLESVLMSFANGFSDSRHKHEAGQILNTAWELLERLDPGKST